MSALRLDRCDLCAAWKPLGAERGVAGEGRCATWNGFTTFDAGCTKWQPLGRSRGPRFGDQLDACPPQLQLAL